MGSIPIAGAKIPPSKGWGDFGTRTLAENVFYGLL